MFFVERMGCHYKETTTFQISRPQGSGNFLLPQQIDNAVSQIEPSLRQLGGGVDVHRRHRHLGVVDPGRGKGVVAESHVAFSRPICGPSKWRNLEDFPPLYPPYSPPKWRDFVVGRETS